MGINLTRSYRVKQKEEGMVKKRAHFIEAEVEEEEEEEGERETKEHPVPLGESNSGENGRERKTV